MKSKRARKQPSEALALADALIENPREKANSLPKLISLLSSGTPDAVPLIQSLKLYFIGCFEREDLNIGKQQSDSSDDLPEAVYTKWLHRQYTNCIDTLLTLLSSSSVDARTQVNALSFLMECVRGEQLGAFNNDLFAKIVVVVATQKDVHSETIGALLTKYAEYADVRYFLLRTLKKVCEIHAARESNAAAADDDLSDNDDDDDAVAGDKRKKNKKDTKTTNTITPSSKPQSSSLLLSPHDMARNIHDFLTALPPIGGSSGGDGGIDIQQQQDANDDGSISLQSWCGAAEFGLVTAADDAIGSRQRKKRKLQQQQQQQEQLDTLLNSVGGNNTKKSKKQQKQQQLEQQVPKQAAKWANPNLHRKVYSDAWLAFLRLSLPEDVYKKVLSQFPDTILPQLTNPLLLSDFLTYSLDKGGLIGMLALNGIFMLVTQHGLEYPKFYERLYNLLSADAFQAKYRARFFQLADIFLASGMVPAYTAAAFVKRFARLALTASPAGALVSIAFIHNIVRRHPACMQLLHRKPSSSSLNKNNNTTTTTGTTSTAADVYQGIDVYDATEPDPAQSRALESSLWELTALQNHANPLVSNFVSILDKDLSNRVKTSEVDISELLTGSYTGLFGKEVERRLKTAPIAFYSEAPVTVFDVGDSNPDFVGWS